MVEGLTIIGIDPGETKGIAILDLEGRLINLKSAKSLNLDSIGKPIAIGCDVNPIPGFVERVAAEMRVKAIVPRSLLKVKEKRIMMKKFRYENKIEVKDRHQRDALVAALIVYKKFRALFRKIDNSLEKINRRDLSDKVKGLVVMKGISIKRAIEMVG